MSLCLIRYKCNVEVGIFFGRMLKSKKCMRVVKDFKNIILK